MTALYFFLFMKNLFLLSLSFLFSVMVVSCRTSKIVADGSTSASVVVTENASVPAVAGRPLSMRRPIMIYRTKADYSSLVPITLDADHNSISNYPDPVDVGPFSAPLQLNGGYLFDRRGIGANTAYTSYTYEAFHALSRVPSVSDFESRIVERYPLLELWDCTQRYYQLESSLSGSSSEERQLEILNSIIADGFKGCRQLLDSVEE